MPLFLLPLLFVPHSLPIPLNELFALLAAVTFAAGLNVYATVAVLGLLGRFGHIPISPGMEVLSSWTVIVASLVLFSIEFFADKIPAFDLIWSALHTFVRVPVAGFLAYRATAQLSPAEHLLAAVLGAAIAFAAHGGKTAVRAAITTSPEPFSNITLSLVEDILAISLTWLATRHPYAAGSVALALVAIVILLTRLVIKALRALFRGADNELAGRPA